MKYFFFLLVFVLFTGYLPTYSWAQAATAYNLNADNGLPSNRVYGMIVDRHGYLWICTDKGIVRYNGYECKLFNQSNGLPTNDVWELIEDKKGKIWLGAISDEVGYLYNNKYRKAALKSDDGTTIGGTFYPSHMRLLQDGIVFHSAYVSKNNYVSLCISIDDTMFVSHEPYEMFLKFFKKSQQSLPIYFPLNDEFGRQIYVFEKMIFSNDIGFENRKKTNGIKLLSNILDSSGFKYGQSQGLISGNYILSYDHNVKSNLITVMNIITGRVSRQKMNIDNYAPIQYMFFEKKPVFGNVFYVVTEKSITKCKIDDTVTAVRKFLMSDFVDTNIVNGNKITTVLIDTFWNYCIGSTSNGAWLKYYDNRLVLQRTNHQLQNYINVGSYGDSLSFLWNRTESSFAIVDKQMNVKYHKFNITRLTYTIHYAGDTFLIGTDNPFLYVLGTSKVIDVSRTIKIAGGFNAISGSKPAFVGISAHGFGIITPNENRAFSERVIDRDRYNALTYDYLRKDYWAYNGNTVIIYKNDSFRTINRNELASLGIKNLQDVDIDSIYGNVFLKGYDNLVIYNPEKKVGRQLFDRMNILDDVHVMVHGKKLMIAWKYGILFSLILGDRKISTPILFYNAKCQSYKTIFGCSILGDKFCLNTNGGLLAINIPTEAELLANNIPTQNSYRFILDYADTITRVKTNDTIDITQRTRKMIFDVIHPNGSGHIRYYVSSSVNPAWQELNSNEVNLTEAFKPDNYYKLHIYASDDSWKSDVLALNLYIQPYWWQTHSAIRFIWISTVLLALLVIITAVFLTRRMVLKATERKHLQMEMELKSIYAQINPHFIFNSLNSALLLVSKNRMDEAYSHIAKFSRLLRSYLKSSRNKYISISEEAENLKNYIELQQTRFKDKFVYEIIVSDTIKQRPVNIPSLLVQPFVENAINHGILQKQDRGRLKVAFELHEQENKVICVIEDDGIGRKQSKLNKVLVEGKTESYGDLMIKDLVSIFNRYEKMSIDISYTDKELPDTGTIVTITIKNPRYE